MLQIDDTIISRDIFEVAFCCDIKKCLGECCIEGDAGAPLDVHECGILEDEIDNIKPFLTSEGVDAIKSQGVFELDQSDGEFVTPLIKGKACAYTYVENSITKCGIEKAFNEGKCSLKKPISCHLYPIRLTQYKSFVAVNYHKWSICNDACVKGEKEGVYIYEFLKEPLIKQFGELWYHELIIAGKELGWIK